MSSDTSHSGSKGAEAAGLAGKSEEHKQSPGSDAGAKSSGASSTQSSTASSRDSGEDSSNLGRLGKLASESRGLIEDLREWVDLRMQLVQVDVEERIQAVANQMAAMLVVLVFGLFTALFLLHGVSVLIGTALGNEAWGYLIVAAFLGVLTLVVHLAKPTLISRSKKDAAGAEKKSTESLSSGPEPKQLTPGEDA